MSAIRRVLEGESPLNQELAMYVISHLASETASESGQEAEQPSSESRAHERQDSPPHPLTKRELEVLRLLAQGQSNQEIAQNLFLSALTIKTHVQRIIGKLGVSDRTQAAVRAAELGLLTPPSA
jgi:DNA-binding NarL/FixJ family response regulator